jgi:hypothetical protein
VFIQRLGNKSWLHYTVARRIPKTGTILFTSPQVTASVFARLTAFSS